MKNRNIKHHDNWATPKSLYDELDKEFSFDFDPCPLNEGEILPENDGLLIEWGSRNFVNPPYSQKLKEEFVKVAIKNKAAGKLCVMLLPVSTSTRLFHDFILPNADDIRFLKGRVKFEGINSAGVRVTGKAGMHDTMIVIFDGRMKKIKKNEKDRKRMKKNEKDKKDKKKIEKNKKIKKDRKRMEKIEKDKKDKKKIEKNKKIKK